MNTTYQHITESPELLQFIVSTIGISFLLGSLFTILMLLVLDMLKSRRLKNVKHEH